MTNPTPGWYSDPEVPGQQRYWDGERWTEHVAPLVHLDAPTRIDVSFRPGFDERAGLTFNDGIITIRDENGDDPPPFSISDVVAIGWNRNGAEGTSIDGICACVAW